MDSGKHLIINMVNGQSIVLGQTVEGDVGKVFNEIFEAMRNRNEVPFVYVKWGTEVIVLNPDHIVNLQLKED